MTDRFMKNHKKSYLSILAGLTITFILVSVIMVMALKKVDIDTTAEQIINDFSEKIHGTLTFHAIELKIFPRPRITIQNVMLVIPGKGDGTIRTLTAYPKILPLLWGKLRISNLAIDTLSSTIFLKDFITKNKLDHNDLSVSTLKQHLDKGIGLIALNFPGLEVQLNDGKMVLVNDEKSVFRFSNINSKIILPPKQINIVLNCHSNLWEHAHISVRMNPKTFDSSGKIDFNNINITAVPENLFPTVSRYISRLSASLNLTFKTDGFNQFKGTAQGSIPDVWVRPSGREPIVLKCSQFKGSFDVTQNQTGIRLDKLFMNDPDVKLSGDFHFDKISPHVSLKIYASEMDVASARKAALSFAGKFRTTQKIFDIVRAGKIPHISFIDRATSIKELKNLENIIIKGRLTEGKLFIRKSLLNLEDVYGDVVVSMGILQGKNLSARLGNSYGKDGKLSIGLIGSQAPFYIETWVDADLIQLPTILKRLIKNEAFIHEMGLLKNCRGHASGKLVLGDRKNAIRPRVEVARLSLSTDYLRTPLTLNLTGGEFLYDKDRIDLKNSGGTLGQSIFSGLSATFDLKNRPALTCRSETATVFLSEIYPWLMSFKNATDPAPLLDSVEGTLNLSETHIKGPLFHPEQWSVKTSGETKGLSVTAKKIFDSPALISGKFSTTTDKLIFSDTTFRFLDAVLNGSGALSGDLEQLSNAQISLTGDLGPQAVQWVSGRIELPFQVNRDTSITLSKSGLNWFPDDQINFSGKMTVPNGPDISIDVSRTVDDLFINSLKIKDQVSDVSLVLSRIKKTVDLDFKGSLNHSTLTKLLAANPFLTGSLTGDFHAGIVMDHPENSWMQGRFQVAGFTFPKQLNLPLKFEKASVEAENNNYKVAAVLVLDNEDKLVIGGNLSRVAQEFVFDLDLFSDGFELERIVQYVQQISLNKPDGKPDKLWDFPVRGNLHVNTRQIRFSGFTWEPVIADLWFSPKEINASITEADWCGIQTPGALTIKPGTMQINLNPVGKNIKLETAFPCLGGKRGLIHGDADVNGIISAEGPFNALRQSIEGNYKLRAKDGRIYRFGGLAKVFALLNITEIFRGKLPDLVEEGFAYTSIEAAGQFEGHKIIINSAVIDGASMDIVFQGEIDHKRNTLNLTLLVAPLKTVDFIIKQTPLVNDILDGTLVSIPFNIRGDLWNPKVTALPPSAVGAGLFGIMKNILKLPVTIIQPLIPKAKNDNTPN